MSKKSTAKNSSATSKKSTFGANVYRNMKPEEIADLCDRMVVMHTTGVYTPPDPKPRVCHLKNKRKTTTSRLTSHNNNIQRTKFGQGRIGVSCESFGVKNCACCRPYSESDTVLQSIPASAFDFDDFDDFTSDDDVVIVDSYPNPSRSPMLSITIEDEPSTSTNNVDLGVLNTDDVDQNNSSSLNENVSTAEVDSQEILDYVNLVTNDLDEANLEEQFLKLIQDELEEEKNKPLHFMCVPTPPRSAPVISTSIVNLCDEFETAEKENILAANTSSINHSNSILNTGFIKPLNNISNVIDITDSPANTAVNVNANLECPICLESFITKEVMSTICGHLFCSMCIKRSIKQNKHCPTCRKKLSLKGIHPIFL